MLECLWMVGRGIVVNVVRAQMRASNFDVNQSQRGENNTTVYKQTHLVPHLQVVKYYSRPIYEDPPYLLMLCTEAYLGKSTLGSALICVLCSKVFIKLHVWGTTWVYPPVRDLVCIQFFLVTLLSLISSFLWSLYWLNLQILIFEPSLMWAELNENVWSSIFIFNHILN